MRKIITILKSIIDLGYWVLMIGLVGIAVLSAMSVLQIPMFFRAFVVQSGSMEPAIKTGSLVFIQPTESYEVGDVITYMRDQNAEVKHPENTITHRIIEKNNEGDALTYTTQGDANDIADLTQVSPSQILGKMAVSIPYLGYPVGYAKTQTGFIVLVVIPATIIVYSELVNMKNEVKKLVEKRKTQMLTPTEKMEVRVEEAIESVEKKVKTTAKKIKKPAAKLRPRKKTS